MSRRNGNGHLVEVESFHRVHEGKRWASQVEVVIRGQLYQATFEHNSHDLEFDPDRNRFVLKGGELVGEPKPRHRSPTGLLPASLMSKIFHAVLKSEKISNSKPAA